MRLVDGVYPSGRSVVSLTTLVVDMKDVEIESLSSP